MNSIQYERKIRFAQLKSSGGDSLNNFHNALLDKPKLIKDLKEYIEFAISIEYKHFGLDSSTYLAHPLRVATIILQEYKNLSVPLIGTALLHNVKEVSEPSFELLQDFCEPSIVKAINILTVNRKKNYGGYRRNYYDRIYAAESFVGVVKIFDKLDNLFMLCLNENESIRKDYLDEIEKFILPLVIKNVPHLENYFLELIKDCKKTGYLKLS